MTRTNPNEAAATLAQRIAIEELNAAFAHCLDHAAYDELGELFSTDAHYASGLRTMGGRDSIVQSFVTRAQMGGPRTTRHMYSGLRLRFDGASLARGQSVWISYACNAAVPVDEVTPFVVADFEDIYVLEEDGQWRIQERVIRPVFRNPKAAPAA